MNFLPFNLAPTAFVFFYVALCAVVYWGLKHWIAVREAPPEAKFPRLTDPYAMAVLRAGPNEAIAIAVVSLMDRGLLIKVQGSLQVVGNAIDLVQRPIEKAVLRFFEQSRAEPTQVYAYREAKAAAEILARDLGQLGLLHRGTAASHQRRMIPTALAVAIVGAIAIARIGFVVPPVALLALLAPAAIAVLIKQYFEPGTALGRGTLEYLQTLFAPRLRELDRLRPGGRSSDAVLLAALFGIDVLPIHLFPGVELVRSKKKSSDSGGCGSSSDSGFHDSDAGGDSGGDGGGGCGGCGG